MPKPPTKSVVLDSGLRYKAKVSGSPFKVNGQAATATLSCFLCGKHRLRSEMKFRTLMGKSQAVCDPKCS
ncbi:MAG: hypothetical protein CFE43_21340 [Burkholderiales bacterium PBB3]|nr:MAG: hypothetical protein CFE43_21340 [Burkholderiales bacterium PBB3]